VKSFTEEERDALRAENERLRGEITKLHAARATWQAASDVYQRERDAACTHEDELWMALREIAMKPHRAEEIVARLGIAPAKKKGEQA